jgi:hypothetical protein
MENLRGQHQYKELGSTLPKHIHSVAHCCYCCFCLLRTSSVNDQLPEGRTHRFRVLCLLRTQIDSTCRSLEPAAVRAIAVPTYVLRPHLNTRLSSMCNPILQCSETDS